MRFSSFPMLVAVFCLCTPLFAGDLHFHGYGELHFNAPTNGDNELDLHRFVLGLNYDFGNRWQFDMEIDFEHAFEEPEFEFMHLDYLHSDSLNFRAGLILMPMGMLNQTHEPNLYYSVERPYVQKAIIPTTWQEPGLGVFGSFGEGFEYHAYLVAGVKAEGDGSKGIRGWRSKGINSSANEGAFMGRLSWGQPGLKLGSSLFYGGVDQGRDLDFSSNLFLWDLDFHLTKGGWDIRGLYANSTVSDVAELNAHLGLEGASSVGENQYGYYVTLGYDLLKGKHQQLIPFVQVEKYDTQDGVPEGFLNKESTEKEIVTVGMSYMPFEKLAIKVDYETWSTPGGDDTHTFNMGVGYQY